ncbi:MAG: 50S ribosomal protein L3 [Candidatus Wallbacteria bacterium]|nr:50S ribosomal protein L3 [Candidatus Wallbacteria bacterium]
MINGLIGKKMGMTQLFAQDGTVTPVTVIQAGPCPVVQVKTAANDGYEAVQVGFDELTKKKLPKAIKERFSKLNVPAQRVLKEFRPLEAGKLPAVGTVLNVKVFEKAKQVKVTGTSKGKGFQGVVRRHGFGGGGRTHGSNFHRAPGAVGCRTTPGEVHKGKRMAGHMGHRQVTARNLVVVKVDPDKNLLYVRGAVPGPINGFVTVLLG